MTKAPYGEQFGAARGVADKGVVAHPIRELVAWAEEQGMDAGSPDERRILTEARAFAKGLPDASSTNAELVQTVLNLMLLCDGWTSDGKTQAQARAVLKKVGAHSPGIERPDGLTAAMQRRGA